MLLCFVYGGGGADTRADLTDRWTSHAWNLAISAFSTRRFFTVKFLNGNNSPSQIQKYLKQFLCILKELINAVWTEFDQVTSQFINWTGQNHLPQLTVTKCLPSARPLTNQEFDRKCAHKSDDVLGRAPSLPQRFPSALLSLLNESFKQVLLSPISKHTHTHTQIL